MSDEQTGPRPRERTQRTWIGEALAAFDQAYTQVASWRDDTVLPPEFWLQRAQIAASIAQAEQARIGNLIAWKQLRQSQPATALSGAGDAITAEIEAVLGITDPETTGEGRDPVEVLTPRTDGLVHVEDGWRIRRTYTVGQPGEIVERLA